MIEILKILAATVGTMIVCAWFAVGFTVIKITLEDIEEQDNVTNKKNNNR